MFCQNNKVSVARALTLSECRVDSRNEVTLFYLNGITENMLIACNYSNAPLFWYLSCQTEWYRVYTRN
ncbi:unnamed protein product [Callosobruchus maculatus]|uniref:Uncharacterized protein n=1 Tax=Callosobruchus maculatus TaxID=64391 RepID=A0A653CQS0_CALMS|nr:unnamed protein product [Callosobruchus maculatus]